MRRRRTDSPSHAHKAAHARPREYTSSGDVYSADSAERPPLLMSRPRADTYPRDHADPGPSRSQRRHRHHQRLAEPGPQAPPAAPTPPHSRSANHSARQQQQQQPETRALPDPAPALSRSATRPLPRVPSRYRRLPQPVDEKPPLGPPSPQARPPPQPDPEPRPSPRSREPSGSPPPYPEGPRPFPLPVEGRIRRTDSERARLRVQRVGARDGERGAHYDDDWRRAEWIRETHHPFAAVRVQGG